MHLCRWRTGREEGGRGRCGGRGEGQRAPVCLCPSLSLRLEGELTLREVGGAAYHIHSII